jgi:hypothetical protein
LFSNNLEDMKQMQTITKELATKVFKELDPSKSADDVAVYVNRGFGEGSSWEWSAARMKNCEVDIWHFLSSMGSGILERSGPRSALLLGLQNQQHAAVISQLDLEITAACNNS